MRRKELAGQVYQANLAAGSHAASVSVSMWRTSKLCRFILRTEGGETCFFSSKFLSRKTALR